MRNYSRSAKIHLMSFIENEGIRSYSNLKGINRRSARKVFHDLPNQCDNVRFSTVLTTFFTHGYEAEIYIGCRGINTVIWKNNSAETPTKNDIENSLELFRKLLLKRLGDNARDRLRGRPEIAVKRIFQKHEVQADILYKTNPASIDELIEALARVTDNVSFFLRQPKRPNPVYYEVDPEDV